MAAATLARTHTWRAARENHYLETQEEAPGYANFVCCSGHQQPDIKRRRPRPTPREAPQTPQPVPGRQHIDLQTEPFLEELTDIVAEEAAGARACAWLLPGTRFVP